MGKRGMKKYRGILTPAQMSKRMIDSAVDFSYAIREGLILGYYDAKHKFHRIRREENPGKIIKNAVAITLIAPAGTVLGPLYLVYKGGIYLIKRNWERAKEGELAGKL